MQLVTMQWLNGINHHFKVVIYTICEVSDAIELYTDFKFVQIAQYFLYHNIIHVARKINGIIYLLSTS